MDEEVKRPRGVEMVIRKSGYSYGCTIVAVCVYVGVYVDVSGFICVYYVRVGTL